jgi:modulator of FtsH protease
METNKVLKNTYLLLSATLGFSAVMAAISMSLGMPFGAYMICLIASMVLGMFVLPRTANSGAGLGVIFLVTGLLGFGLGPVISMYLTLSNGAQVVATALGGTATMFLGLSAYAVASKRDFSFMGGFVTVGYVGGNRCHGSEYLHADTFASAGTVDWHNPADECAYFDADGCNYSRW